MSTRRVVLCGVPSQYCTGGKYSTDQNLPDRCHSSSTEAFRCMKRYLLLQGYEQIGPREFRPPDGGPIRVLRKRTKFGASLRAGKGGDRFMPDEKISGNRGTII